MGLYFEAKLREAEQTINNLIEAAKREGGGVYICDRDGESNFADKLTQPIRIVYWMSVEQRDSEKWSVSTNG